MQDSQAPLPSDADNCRIDKRNMPMRKLSRCRGRIESTRLAVDGIRARGRTAWLLLTGPCEVQGGRSQRPSPALNDDRGNYRVLHCVNSVCIRIRFDRWAYTETWGCGSASVEQCRSGVRGFGAGPGCVKCGEGGACENVKSPKGSSVLAEKMN